MIIQFCKVTSTRCCPCGLLRRCEWTGGSQGEGREGGGNGMGGQRNYNGKVIKKIKQKLYRKKHETCGLGEPRGGEGKLGGRRTLEIKKREKLKRKNREH